MPSSRLTRPAVPAVWAVGAALLALVPAFTLHPFMANYDAQRVLVAAATVVLGVAVAAVPSVRAAWLRTWARLPRWAAAVLAGLLVLGLASSAGAARPAYAFLEVASMALLVVAAVAVASAGREGARSGLAFTALLVLGGYAAVVIGVTLLDRGAPAVWPERLLGYVHVRFLNQVQAWLIPVVWAVAASERSGRALRGVARVVGAASVALAIASFGRGLPVALGVGLAAMAVMRGGGRALLREAALSLLTGVAVWALVFLPAGGLTALTRPPTGTTGRAGMWLGCLRMIAAAPWLGLGPMHFALYQGRSGAHPHNLLMQIAVEWGVAAALLLGVLILGGLAAWLRHARRPAEDAPWRAGLTAMLVTALVYAMVDGMLVTPTAQLAAALALGALLAEALPEAAAPRAVSVRASAVLAACALTAAAVVVGVVASEVPRLADRSYDLRFAHAMERQTPRYWTEGQLAARFPADRARFWPDLPGTADGSPVAALRPAEGTP